MSFRPPVVLTFAASDPTGGAGLQADLLTLGALGCHPLSVLTGFTVQDTHGVHRLQAIDAAAVAEQARCVLDDIAVDAIKLGVLASPDNVRAVAAVLAAHAGVPVVLDPVLASGRGDELAADAVIAALCDEILPRVTLATPNAMEAHRLGGVARMIALGCKYVLVTGTHAETHDVVNTLHSAHGVVREDRWKRLPGSYHGSGCTLASAVAASLARGRAAPEAVREAQAFTWQALASAFRAGAGQLIPRRFLSQ